MTWTHDAADDFKEVYGGPPPPQYFKNLQGVVKKYGWDKTRSPLKALMRETPLKFLSIPKTLAVMIERGNGHKESVDRLDERHRLDAAEAWLEKAPLTFQEHAHEYLRWEKEYVWSRMRAKKEINETEAQMRRRWAREIGAPEEIGALLSQDIYRARKT